MWFVDDSQSPVAEWSGDSPLGITSATISYYYYDGDTKKYIQNDMTTSTVPWTFPMTNTTSSGPNASAWTHDLTVPVSVLRFNLTWEATSNQTDLPPIGETHFVGPFSANNLDLIDVLGIPLIKAGEPELHAFIWKTSEGVTTTGTATIKFYVTANDGSRAYLQNDLANFGPTETTFNLTLSGNRWEFLLTTPGTGINKIMTAEATHSDPVLPIVAINYSIIGTTLDEVKSALTDPTKELLFSASQ